jgi:signal transduction histidine kinase
LKRLETRYWLVISLLIVLALGGVGALDMWFAYRDGLERIRALQEADSKIAGTQIEQNLRTTERYIREVAGLPWAAGIFREDDRELEFQRLLKLVPALFEIRAIDEQGRERLHVSHGELNRFDSGRDWSMNETVQRAQSQAIAYSPVYFRDDSAPFVSLAIRQSDRTRGLTLAELDLRFVADAVKALQVGRQGGAYVVDSANLLVAHPNLNLVLRKSDLSHLPQVKAARAAFDSEAPQILPTMWGRSPEGGDVLSSAYFIPGPGWVVFVEQPAREALDAVRATTYRALLVLIAGLLLAFVGSRLLARRLTQPILSVQQGAARIGAGDLTARLSVHTGDEIEALANQFNQMAERLAEYTAGLERKVAERTKEVELANRHKREFLANMSHELRTPLYAIIGFSEVLKERMFGELNPKQAEYIHDIHESGLHLLSLINDILDLTKDEAGRMELEPSEFDIAPVLENVLILTRERAQRGQLKVELEVQEDLKALVADQRKIKQILLNLVTNAVKFTRPGGRVTIAVTQDDETTSIAVTDTGIGIAPEDTELIFAEFHQVRSAGDIRFEGTGLGLALTKALVELHRGRITLQSEVGKGSTFSIRIPTRQP